MEPRTPGLVRSEVTRTEGMPDQLPAAVASLHSIGAGLWAELSTSPGNLALSPYSAGVALGMTLNGARGSTLTEMLGVLAARRPDRLNGGLNALTRHVDGLAGPKQRGDGSRAELALRTANQLFGQHGTRWERPFLDTLAREYGAGLRDVDFVAATEEARRTINAWTAEQTRDRIPEILPGGVLDTLTRLVLVNALYLKAPWERPFEDFNTKPRPFHLADGTSVRVPTMSAGLQNGWLGRGQGWRSVRLDYAGRELAMTLLVPDPGRLDDLEAAVARGELPSMLASVRSGGVLLSLPRWTFRTQSPLKATLSALGMPTAFDPVAADFSAMTSEEQLYLQAVLQEVFIAVDEEGTEAAAATAVVAGTTSAPVLEPVEVDRPFLFVVHDVEHGTPLFVGRVSDPR